MKAFGYFALVSFFVLLVASTVSAQQVPQSVLDEQSHIRLPTQREDQPTPTPDINEAIDNSAEIARLQQDYFKLLEQYRSQEQSYEVARAQYLQLNTLASQELAVKETRQLLSTRADVFLTYLQIIALTLEQTKGIPLENKNAQLVNLTLLQEQVKIHKNTVLKVSDRINLDAESTNFVSIIEMIKSQAYYSLSLIRLGTMQSAYDKLLVVRDAVEQEVESRKLSVAIKAEKERGFQEIDRTIDAVLLELQPLQKSIFLEKSVKSVGQLSTLSTSISSPYSKVRQATEFLREIRK